MDLAESIKKHAPAALRVELEDGTLRTVPMAKSGNKWSRAVKVLDALSWVKVECLDAKGGVLGIVEAELDEDDDGVAGGAGDGAAIARVMLDVMKSTLREFRATFGDQLKGMAEMQKAMTDGLAAVTESYQTALRVQAAHLTAVSGAGDGNDEVMKMLQMAMMMGNRRVASPVPKEASNG